MVTPWSAKGTKATPVNADELMIIDSADANPATTNKLITIGTMPFVTNPLTSNIDGATFELNNISRLSMVNGEELVSDPTASYLNLPSQEEFEIRMDGNAFILLDNNATEIVLDADVNIAGNSLIEVGTLVAEGPITVEGDVLSVLGSGYIDIQETGGDPGVPASTIGRLYTDDLAGTTTLYFQDDTGTITNLLAGGGSQTPWTSNIAGAGFALLDSNYIEAGNSLGTSYAAAGEVRLPSQGIIGWRNENDDGDNFIQSEDTELSFNGWDSIVIPTPDVDIDFGSASVFGIVGLEVGSNGLDMGDGPMTSVATIQYSASNDDNAISFGNTEVASWSKVGAGFAGISSNASDELVLGFSATSPGALVAEYTFTETQFTIAEGNNIVLGTSTGTQIGTATTQLLGFYGATAVNQPDALTAQDTTIIFSAPGTPDFAIQTLTQTSPFGFVNSNEAQTVLQVIANLQTRVQEIENRLEELGLVATN